MKIIVAVIVALCVVSASARPARDDATLFSAFKDKYNKVYETEEEEARRFGIFRSTLDRVERKNREHVHAGGDEVFGVTKFSDLTEDEFANWYLMKNYERPSLALEHYAVLEASIDGPLPTSYDWNNHSPAVITPVKNQGQCGSCWAFSTAEEVESMWALAGNPLVALSPQQIVDCDKGEDGCGGGDTVQAYGYVEQAGGLVPEKDYPYTAENGACKNSIVKNDIAAKIMGFNYATSPSKKNETQMMVNLVSTGPISICADAATWQDYSSGIIKHGCGQQLDHCIQITGYGVDQGTQYWNIRNSWGTDWGYNGYLRVETMKNLCGVADEATIVTITSAGTASTGTSTSSGSYSSSGSSSGYSSSSGSSSGSSSSGGSSSGYSSSY